MESSKQPQDEKFFELMLRATHIAFEYAKRAEADGKYIRSHSGFPTVRFFDNGFPYIGKDIYSKVKDYSYIFTDVYPEIKIEDLPEFQVLLDYIRSHETLKQYFMPTDTWGGAFEILAWRVPLQLLDRYMHAYKDQDFIVKNFLEIYLPIETGLLSTRLDIHVAVPILFVKFDFDAIEIGPGAYVGKMNDLFQLARIDITSNNSRGNLNVMSAASHWLILTDWYYSPGSIIDSAGRGGSIHQYPIDAIDRFFGALRIAHNLHTGYAQMLQRPVNWATSYKANLPPLLGIQIHKYPAFFEDNYWPDDVPMLTTQDMIEVSSLYTKLRDANRKEFDIAISRLNRCLIREDEEDSILDATIGLEALCSESPQEIVYKLRLRVAALLQLVERDGYSAKEIFDNVKRIYDYRSAIAHGLASADKNREISLEARPKIPTISKAIEYLRKILKALILHPEFLDTKRLDEELVLGKLSSLAASNKVTHEIQEKNDEGEE